MRVSELKALAREHGLRCYSRLRKAEIIELIRNNQQGWAPDIPPRNGTTRPPRPTRPKLNRLGLDQIGPRGPPLRGAGLVHKKWIYLNNRR